MTNEEQKKRAKVTGITINLVDPDGYPRTVTIDPKFTKALFWDDKSVVDILGGFYENHNSVMTREDLIALFGTIGKKVAGANKKIKLSKEVVKKLWEEEDENGQSLSLLGKTYLCTLAPGGDA